MTTHRRAWSSRRCGGGRWRPAAWSASPLPRWRTDRPYRSPALDRRRLRPGQRAELKFTVTNNNDGRPDNADVIRVTVETSIGERCQGSATSPTRRSRRPTVGLHRPAQGGPDTCRPDRTARSPSRCGGRQRRNSAAATSPCDRAAPRRRRRSARSPARSSTCAPATPMPAPMSACRTRPRTRRSTTDANDADLQVHRLGGKADRARQITIRCEKDDFKHLHGTARPVAGQPLANVRHARRCARRRRRRRTPAGEPTPDADRRPATAADRRRRRHPPATTRAAAAGLLAPDRRRRPAGRARRRRRSCCVFVRAGGRRRRRATATDGDRPPGRRRRRGRERTRTVPRAGDPLADAPTMSTARRGRRADPAARDARAAAADHGGAHGGPTRVTASRPPGARPARATAADDDRPARAAGRRADPRCTAAAGYGDYDGRPGGQRPCQRGPATASGSSPPQAADGRAGSSRTTAYGRGSDGAASGGYGRSPARGTTQPGRLRAAAPATEQAADGPAGYGRAGYDAAYGQPAMTPGAALRPAAGQPRPRRTRQRPRPARRSTGVDDEPRC